MHFRPCRAREEPEANLVPPIDVLLVILIFLMITAMYSCYTELKADLPTVEVEKAAGRPDQIVVSVVANGVYSVDKQVLDTHGVTNLVDVLCNAAGKAGGPEPIVIVNTDARAVHQATVDVVETAHVTGLSYLIFTTQTGNAH